MVIAVAIPKAVSVMIFHRKRPRWPLAWKRTGSVCTGCTSVNVDHSSVQKTPTLALFVCGGGDLTAVKDCPCVLPKNYQVQCSCQKGFPLPNVFRHKCPGLNNRYGLRWEMLQCHGDSGWYTLTLIFVGPGHYPPSVMLLYYVHASTKYRFCACR